jgi:uncharacterized membrane protein YkoI
MRPTVATAIAAALTLTAVAGAKAQDTTRIKPPIPISKEPAKASPGEVTLTPWTLTPEKFRLDLEPITVPTGCTALIDTAEVHKVTIKSDLYQPGMVSPDSAKFLALCVIPGQISSGEMHTADNRTMYEISVLPEKKQTNAKVIIDAKTGEVLSSKTYGGLRGLAGYLRESMERKENKVKPPTDSVKPPKPPL